MLTLLIALPLVGALLLFLAPVDDRQAKAIAFVAAIATFGLSLGLWTTHAAGLEWQEVIPWVPSLGIDYRIGVDGLSFFLVLLTTLVAAVVIPFIEHESGVRHYLALALMLETAALGAFVSLDLLLFYIFWEAMLIPAYFLIIRYGGPAGPRAALKFLLFSLIPSLFMLISILVLAHTFAVQHGHWSFALSDLLSVHLPTWEEVWLFLGFFVAFAVKVPLFPLHSWMPDAYGESSPPVTVLLSSVLSKTGLYAFLRIAFPLLPAAVRVLTPLLVALALVGILYGAFIALVHRDAKLVVAYSSLSHLSLIFLGIVALDGIAWNGAILQMLNHGIYMTALFLLLGNVERAIGTRDVDRLGGLAARAPMFFGFLWLAVLAALGLPGLNGFAGEFTLLLGIYARNAVWAWIAAFASIFAAAYFLRVFQKTAHGPERAPSGVPRLDTGQVLAMVPLVLLMLFLGFHPGIVPERSQPTVQHYVSLVGSSQRMEVAER